MASSGASGIAGGGTAGTEGGGRSGADAGLGGAGGVVVTAGTGSEGGNAGSGGSDPEGAGGGGAGGASPYNPCPTDGSPCKILPFGDSITYGDKSSDKAGYRSQLFKLIVAAKQKVTFIGSRADGPTQVSGQPFPRTHEGHPGWTIDPGYNPNPSYGGISSLVPAPALSGDPHVILLHIGTNDLFARDTQNMAIRLEALLDKIVLNAPTALIVLAQITPRGSSDAALTTYNGKIPGIVQSRAAKGQHIIGVDMSKLPVPADLHSDGTHPNDQGYAYMANVWYAALKDFLPK
ncbi:MAG TPA: SGNH/GDSL hydrolase family protein [Polyangiaceae bacterium]|nr:SGNH/GDSL hydrolase family protein [Polyangiaceae bacterium]